MNDPTIVVHFPADGRPPAPTHLSPAESETWRAVVGARKAGFFGPEVFPLLEAYCATALACDHIAARLRVLEEIDHSLYETYDRMTRSLADLAKALGLLPGDERADD
jgi:phage terminase small subunit